jgi:hypothetical protein
MRPIVVAVALGALALVAVSVPDGPAVADKTRMGCDRDTEVWNAALGRCEAGTPKWKRKVVAPPPPPEPVKAAPKAKGKAKAKAKAKGKSAPAAK